jgi:hypothetical protein
MLISSLERRTRLELDEVATNILKVSCDTFKVRIVSVQVTSYNNKLLLAPPANYS